MNRAEHQRSILATLGIDVWIPQVDVRVESYIPQNYRDMETSEQTIVTSLEFAIPQKIIPTQPPIQSKPVAIQQNIEKTDIQSTQVKKLIVSQSIEPLAPNLQIDAFDVQLYALEHCVLLLDATDLNDEQRELWRNIQASMQGREATLHWPFPLINIQDGRGVAQYLQGFIDVYGVEKQLICVGEIPHLNMDQCTVLASLQQMLEQPTLKRNLWQVMRAKVVV